MEEEAPAGEPRRIVKRWLDPLRAAACLGLLAAFIASMAVDPGHTGGGPVIAMSVLLLASGIVLLGTFIAAHRRTPLMAQILTGIYGVIVIAVIVIALAVPMIPYGRWRASDKAAQASLRDAVAAYDLIFCDDDFCVVSASELEAADPSTQWTLEPSTGYDEVSWRIRDSDKSFNVAAMSESGTCWFLRDSREDGTTYGESDDAEILCAGDRAAERARSPDPW